MLNTYRQFRPVYNGPAYRDIASSIVVCMLLSTGYALKHVFRTQTLLSAFKANPAGISRVHKFYRYPNASGLIGNQLLKLIKAPARHQAISMRVPNKSSLADAAELFHPDQSGIVPLGFLNELFRKIVVIVSNSSSFVSGKCAKFFSRASGPFGLKACADFLSPLFKSLSVLTGSIKASRNVGRITKTKIDADGNPFHQRRLRFFDCDVQIPLIAPFDESSASGLLTLQSLLLIFSDIQKCFFPSLKSHQRHSEPGFPKSKNTGVVFDASWSELVGFRTPFFLLRQGSCDSSDRTNRQISTQVTLFPNLCIGQAVKCYSIPGFCFKRFGQYQIASFGKGLSCFQKGLLSFLSNRHLATDGSNQHNSWRLYNRPKIFLTKKEQCFLPDLKDSVSALSIG